MPPWRQTSASHSASWARPPLRHQNRHPALKMGDHRPPPLLPELLAVMRAVMRAARGAEPVDTHWLQIALQFLHGLPAKTAERQPRTT